MTSPSARLPEGHLRLAIASAIVDQASLDDVVQRLWREDPKQVERIYHSINGSRVCDGWRLSGYHRRREERRKRKLETRHRFGLTIRQIAAREKLDHATLVCLLEHHGLIALVQFGLDQRRRLVTSTAFNAEIGHNVYTTRHIGHLEGQAKASPFPVFYEERLPEIMWMLDYPGICSGVFRQPTKKLKLSWLLDHHPYLPDTEIARLAGYSSYGVSKARVAKMPDAPSRQAKRTA